MSYELDKLNAASDLIAEAMRQTNFKQTGAYMELIENVVPDLDRIRGKMLVAEMDEARRK
jgi:hypothetical protein